MSGKNIKINRKKGNGNGETSIDDSVDKNHENVDEDGSQMTEPDTKEQKQTEPEPTPQQKVAELTDRLQRLAAEFENYKKKNAREFERGHRAGSAFILEKLLPVMDSFDIALQQSTDNSNRGILEGVGKIRKQLFEALMGIGLEAINPQKGDDLDPNMHEVVLVEQTEDQPEDTIFATLQCGYSYKNQLIRAAKVQVAKSP